MQYSQCVPLPGTNKTACSVSHVRVTAVLVKTLNISTRSFHTHNAGSMSHFFKKKEKSKHLLHRVSRSIQQFSLAHTSQAVLSLGTTWKCRVLTVLSVAKSLGSLPQKQKLWCPWQNSLYFKHLFRSLSRFFFLFSRSTYANTPDCKLPTVRLQDFFFFFSVVKS